MNNITKILITAGSVFLLSGCGDDTAINCADSDTLEKIQMLAEMKSLKNDGETITNELKFSVGNIKALNSKENIGGYQCSAELNIEYPGGETKIPINYDTSTEKGIVSVSGLNNI